MEWDPKKRPDEDVCPKLYCVHWVPSKGAAWLAKLSTHVCKSSQEVFQAQDGWVTFPNGGCACPYGRCSRLPAGTPAVETDATSKYGDMYESHVVELERDGLPWFYFCTLGSLRPEFHDQFRQESEQLWGSQIQNSVEPGSVADGPSSSL